MVINLFQVIAIMGLLCIIAGNLMISMKRKIRRRFTYPLLLIGGICLEIYSIYLGDFIFIILQGVFIIASIYGIIKIHNQHYSTRVSSEAKKKTRPSVIRGKSKKTKGLFSK
ncbi:hypothetical protein HOD88_00665 [archaeon]|jgi:hypothetical protein|nr:hypothetical protein [archaeon]